MYPIHGGNRLARSTTRLRMNREGAPTHMEATLPSTCCNELAASRLESKRERKRLTANSENQENLVEPLDPEANRRARHTATQMAAQRAAETEPAPNASPAVQPALPPLEKKEEHSDRRITVDCTKLIVGYLGLKKAQLAGRPTAQRAAPIAKD